MNYKLSVCIFSFFLFSKLNIWCHSPTIDLLSYQPFLRWFILWANNSMALPRKVEVLACWTVPISKPIISFLFWLEEKGGKIFLLCLLPTSFLWAKLFPPSIQGIRTSQFNGNSSLWAHRKDTASAPEELFPLEVWRHGDHWETGLTSGLKALALHDRPSAASWEK